MESKLEKNLDAAGYKLFGNTLSIEQLILDILETKNTRYLKAIPFLIYKHQVDIKVIFNQTKNPATFRVILGITMEIFKEFNIAKQIPFETGLIREKPRSNYIVSSGYARPLSLDYLEFRNEFEMQSRNENAHGLLIDKQRINEERNLQFWTSKLFTRKEKQIMKRILDNKPISKTDSEYYSRKTKKKLKAIIDLQDFARALHEKKPQDIVSNKDIQAIKAGLEELLPNKNGGIIILSYSIVRGDTITINYKRNGENYSPDQMFNTQIKLKEIKDETLQDILKKCWDYEFA